jgi:Holliday junction resolvase
MTPEAKVKKVVVKHLKSMGAYYFYPVTGGYGGSGVPDIVACYDGKFFGIECKAGKNKPTPLQEKNLRDIRKAGGVAVVINEDNMNRVELILKDLPYDPDQLTFDFGDDWNIWHDGEVK